MVRRILLGLCCLAMLAAALAVPALQAQSGSGLRLVTELTLPGSNETKFPHVAAGRGQVYVSGNVNRSRAVYWAKQDNGISFPDYFEVGDAGGQPDWSNTSVTVGPNGTVYYAWVDAPSRTIYVRTIDAAGNLGPLRTVDNGSPFPISVEVAVSTRNEIFVAWRDPDEPVKFRYSTDGGVNWSGRAAVSDVVAFASPLDLAAGPSGKVAISFTGGAGGRLQIFTGLWDSNSFGFIVQQVTVADGDYADSSVTIAPDGKVYTSWRGVADSGVDSGVYYAERQSDGSWPRSRIIGGKVTGTVNLDADEQGNLHFSWIGQPSGGNQLYYAYKPAAADFRGPVASGNTGAIFNSHGAASGGANGIFAHVAMEWFSGSRLYTRYSLFQAEGAIYGANPLIEGGAAVVGGKTSAQVTFTDPTALNPATTQVRWRWNAAPTDTANDSGGWQTYASTITVPIPAALRSSTACSTSTLYTQLRDTQRGLVQDPAKSDTILVDGVVQGSALVQNPFLNIPDALEGSEALPAELALSKGAAGDGEPTHTRVPLVYLDVRSLGDCTGIASISIGKSADAIETTYKTESNGFAGLIPLPDLANLETGLQPVVVQVRDGAGNVQTSTFNIVFDDVAPVLVSAGSPSTTANLSGDILQNLTFSNVQVTDNVYSKNNVFNAGTRQFWGVWVANSTTNLSPAAAVTSLKWKAMPVAETGPNTFVVKDWSLAYGLDTPPSSGTATTYYVYVRFLDGAGNTTTADPLKLTVTSNSLWPESYLPQVQR